MSQKPNLIAFYVKASFHMIVAIARVTLKKGFVSLAISSPAEKHHTLGSNKGGIKDSQA